MDDFAIEKHRIWWNLYLRYAIHLDTEILRVGWDVFLTSVGILGMATFYYWRGVIEQQKSG